MWADDPNASWLGPWGGLHHCGECHALIGGIACPHCGMKLEAMELTDDSGKIIPVPHYITQGALSWTAHVLIDLMKREWQRPPIEWESLGRKPSQRMLVVILFWTLFEHLMDRFFDAATHCLPGGVKDDLLRRYSGIGSRMDRLYRALFDTTLRQDFISLGYGEAWSHLEKVQDRRNRFVHGEAEIIDDGLVNEVVERLPDVQAAWIGVYNKRCTGNPDAPPVWEGSWPA